jgi:PAS domain S-box-containing protein
LDEKFTNSAHRTAERLRLALAAARVGTWEWEVATGQVTWSELTEEIFGLPPGGFAGTYEAYMALVHAEDRKLVEDAIQRTLTGQDFEISHRIVWNDGSLHWLDCKGRLYRDAKGEPERLIGTVLDVTKRVRAEEELRRVEDIFRAVVEDQNEMIVRWLPDGTRTFVNSSYCRTFGITKEQALGTSFFPLVKSEYLEQVKSRVHTLTPEAPICSDLHESVLPSGEQRWQEWTDRAFFDAEGKVVMLQSVGRDVTKRVKAEQALHAKEQLLRQLIKHTPAAVAMFDRDLHYLQVSDRWLSDYDLRSEEVIGRHSYDVSPHIPDHWRRAVERALEGSVERCDEDMYYRADGRAEWMQWEIQPWLRANGSVGGVIIFTKLITERKLAEQALRSSEDRFRSAMEHSPVGMAIVDENRRFVEVNPALCRIVGYSRDELLGVGFEANVHPDDLVKYAAAQRAMLQRELESYSAEVRYAHKQGYERWVQLSSSVVWNGDGTPRYFIAQIQDITERKQAEAALEQLHHSQRLDTVGRLAGGIAHDFNNLLTVIIGQLELMRVKLARGMTVLDHVDAASEASESAAALTRQLLLFARKQPATPSVLDLNEVVLRTNRMLQRLIGEEIRLVVAVDPKTPPVWMDAGQLEQVLLNLAVNAKDAMPQGGTLTIETASVRDGAHPRLFSPGTARGFARMRMTDTGVGIEDSVLPHIFEPFFTTKSIGKGTGIGLATVQRVVNEAGGFVDVASTRGKGTRFDVYLPASEHKTVRAGLVQGDVPQGHGEFIVLVEDQQAVRTVAATQLRMLGYDVLTFESAEEALERVPAQLERVDLVVTDVVMRGLDGPGMVEVLRKIRPDLRVLYISGYSDEVVLARGLDTKLSSLLRKPFTLESLAQTLRSVLSTAPRASVAPSETRAHSEGPR